MIDVFKHEAVEVTSKLLLARKEGPQFWSTYGAVAFLAETYLVLTLSWTFVLFELVTLMYGSYEICRGLRIFPCGRTAAHVSSSWLAAKTAAKVFSISKRRSSTFLEQ
jgi:hypothetical protein